MMKNIFVTENQTVVFCHLFFEVFSEMKTFVLHAESLSNMVYAL